MFMARRMLSIGEVSIILRGWICREKKLKITLGNDCLEMTPFSVKIENLVI